ncbi:hypothetical protein F2Q70_00020755 [Brassica cretica]|uniref:Uncharacterized protein n=1 Tax=Brassica cretica TaxID=69181 RepID=A0A8S9GGZ8_BRACR|nr:hypothetical protein F2Q70_00020755 [Brassica cretica]
MACGITDGPSKDFPMIRKMPINREFLWEAEMVKIKAQDLKGKEVRVSNFCKHCIIVTYKFAIGTAVRLNTRLLYQQTKFNLLREKARDMPNWFWIALKLNEIMTCYSILFPSFPSLMLRKFLDLNFNTSPVRFIDAGPASASAAMFFIKVCSFHRHGYLRLRLRPNAASSVSRQKNQRSRLKFRVYLI